MKINSNSPFSVERISVIDSIIQERRPKEKQWVICLGFLYFFLFFLSFRNYCLTEKYECKYSAIIHNVQAQNKDCCCVHVGSRQFCISSEHLLRAKYIHRRQNVANKGIKKYTHCLQEYIIVHFRKCIHKTLRDLL